MAGSSKNNSLALGREIRDFYDHGFPEEYYHDDSEITLDDEGRWLLEDYVKYDLRKLGSIFHHSDWRDCKTFESAFKEWTKKKSKITATLLVEVPLGDKDKAIEAIKALGYKVE